MTQIPRVGDVMTPVVYTIDASASLLEAQNLMADQDLRHLPVLKEGKLVGLLSDRDLKLAMQFPVPSDTIVEHVMTYDPYVVNPETPLNEVANTMARFKYGSVLVQDSEGQLRGIFTSIDALEVLATTLGQQSHRAAA
jgi:acetoin utilization protein AcuB